MRLGLVVSALIATAGTSRAETVTERARRLFEEGRALADRDEPGACPRFEESYRLVAAAGTGFNLAECMERAGNFVRARELFEAIAIEYERDGKAKRAAIARERAAALRDKLGEIVLELDPEIEQLVLVVGGQRVTPAAAIRQLANPGELAISATAPGRRAFVSTIDVRAGERETVRVVLPPIADAPPRETRRRRSRVYLAIGLGATSVAAFVTGGIVFAGARQLDSRGEHDRAVTRADVATAIGAGGVALAVAGIIVFVTAPRDRVDVVPTATRESAGIAIRGRF